MRRLDQFEFFRELARRWALDLRHRRGERAFDTPERCELLGHLARLGAREGTLLSTVLTSVSACRRDRTSLHPEV